MFRWKFSSRSQITFTFYLRILEKEEPAEQQEKKKEITDLEIKSME